MSQEFGKGSAGQFTLGFLMGLSSDVSSLTWLAAGAGSGQDAQLRLSQKCPHLALLASPRAVDFLHEGWLPPGPESQGTQVEAA